MIDEEWQEVHAEAEATHQVETFQPLFSLCMSCKKLYLDMGVLQHNICTEGGVIYAFKKLK